MTVLTISAKDLADMAKDLGAERCRVMLFDDGKQIGFAAHWHDRAHAIRFSREGKTDQEILSVAAVALKEWREAYGKKDAA